MLTLRESFGAVSRVHIFAAYISVADFWVLQLCWRVAITDRWLLSVKKSTPNIVSYPNFSTLQEQEKTKAICVGRPLISDELFCGILSFLTLRKEDEPSVSITLLPTFSLYSVATESISFLVCDCRKLQMHTVVRVKTLRLQRLIHLHARCTSEIFVKA